jgi:CheY-like chemotaxis protein
LPAEPAPAAQQAGGHETILIAEDDPDVLAVTARVLASRGYQVITADDGERALELARDFQGNFHLLVTDVLMPGMHGPELAERITSEYRGVPVLYISGYPRPEISSGVLEGDALLIKKPFTPGALLEKVRQALNTRSRTTPQ